MLSVERLRSNRQVRGWIPSLFFGIFLSENCTEKPEKSKTISDLEILELGSTKITKTENAFFVSNAVMQLIPFFFECEKALTRLQKGSQGSSQAAPPTRETRTAPAKRGFVPPLSHAKGFLSP